MYNFFCKLVKIIFIKAVLRFKRGSAEVEQATADWKVEGMVPLCLCQSVLRQDIEPPLWSL